MAEQTPVGADGAVVVLEAGRAERAGVAALGVVRAADEGAARARGAHRQPSLAAVRAQPRVGPVFGRREQVRLQHLVDLLEHLGDAQLGGLGDRGREIAPEPAQQLLVVRLAVRDPVQILFQIGGEVIIDVAPEVVGQERCDEPSLVLGHQPALVLLDIAAVLDRGHDRGIGRGPADAELFHLLDQRRFGVAGRRLGEVLLGRDLAFGRGLARGDLRQALVVVALGVVAAFLVDLDEAVEQHHLAGGAKADLAVGRADLDDGALEPGGGHLAGEGALPDQVVELALVVFGHPRLVGRQHHVGRPDAFVRFLRVLGLVLVHPGAVRQVLGAELGLDRVARGHHRLGRHVDAVGPHVGDEPGLVEPLRRATSSRARPCRTCGSPPAAGSRS